MSLKHNTYYTCEYPSIYFAVGSRSNKDKCILKNLSALAHDCLNIFQPFFHDKKTSSSETLLQQTKVKTVRQEG